MAAYSLDDTNLFAYCANNPVIRSDSEGNAFDTIFDVVSLASSVAEVIANPSNPWAWAGLVGDVIDVAVPFVSGIGEATRAVKAVTKIDEVNDTLKAVERVHGNSLKTTKPAIGYALCKVDTGKIMKFGETTRGVKRYTKKFYISNNVQMVPLAKGTKREMHYWQHEQIVNYYKQNGYKPPWNKSFW